jgi:hypothetical protein
MTPPLLNIDHPVEIINNSFYQNTADVYGGAVYSMLSNFLVINSVFWKDTSNSIGGQEIYILSMNDTLEIANSNFDPEKVRGIIVDGGGNINADPLFNNFVPLLPEHWSPCVETGTRAYTCQCGDIHGAPAYDILGVPRPVGSGYDMGAYDIEGWGMAVEPINNYGLIINNKPNPFTGSTTISYTLTEPCTVTLRIMNGFGQVVAVPVNDYQQKGEQRVTWNAEGLPAGIYFYTIDAGGKTAGGKMVKE